MRVAALARHALRTARLSAAQPLCAAPQLPHRSPLIFHRSPPLSSLAAPPAPRTRRLFFGGGSMESEKLNASAGMATRAEMESGATGELSRAAAAAAVPSEHLFGDKIPGRLRDRRSPMAPETQGVGEGAPSAPPRDDPPFSADGFPAGHIGVSDEQGKRSYMEDRHTAIPTFRLPGAADPGLLRQFVAIYDGHSSHHGSEHASRRVHEFVAGQPAIQACQGDACDQSAVEAALKAAFEGVDEEIVETAVAGGKRYGTTAVCALRVGNTLYVAHAGDSRAVLCRDGAAITLTRDHKPASVPQERARIEAQGGEVLAERDYVIAPDQSHMANMSRALGDPDFKAPRRLVEAEPDVAHVQLRKGDRFLLLGSDGLFDVMSDQQAVDAAARALDDAGRGRGASEAAAEAAADALVQQALEAGTRDNVTALLLVLDW